MSLERASELRALGPTAQIVEGDGTSLVQIGAAYKTDVRWDAIACTSTSLTPRVVTLYVDVFSIGSVVIPAGAGYGVVPAEDLLAGAEVVQRDGLVMPALAELYAAVDVALGAGETIGFVLQGGTLAPGVQEA
jgi:hypothetical protein